MQPQDPNSQNQNPENQPAPGAYQPPAQQSQPESETPQDPQPSQPVEAQPQPAQEGPQQMYYSRPLEPQQPIMTPEIQRKCEESKTKYPQLNLSKGEYIVSDVRRHWIGMLQIWAFVFLVIAAVLTVVALIMSGADSSSSNLPKAPIAGIAILLCVLALIGGYIAAFVYRANRFYLTNESVIQNIQLSLFANREQTVSLGNIEDASYNKHGIIQTIFDYGTIRLSTQGDETTYRFSYALQPAKQVSKLNNAVEAFKNGRPFDDDDPPRY